METENTETERTAAPTAGVSGPVRLEELAERFDKEEIDALTHAHGGADTAALLTHADAVRWLEHSQFPRIATKYNTNEIKSLINILLKDAKELLQENRITPRVESRMALLNLQVALLTSGAVKRSWIKAL